jgi:hypothetical protein
VIFGHYSDVPVQLLVRAAYGGALGHPLIPDPDNLHHLTPETLAAFVEQNYTGRTGKPKTFVRVLKHQHS